MPADYFPWGEFETSKRTVGTGTVFSDWDGDADGGRSPGVTVAENDDGETVIRLGEPEYEIIQDWEESNDLLLVEDSSEEQTVSLSYDESFSGDLSLLLEHEEGYDENDRVLYREPPIDSASKVDGVWVVSVNWFDLTSGCEVILPQFRHYNGLSGPLYSLTLLDYDESNDEIIFRSMNNEESKRFPATDEWLYGPVVMFCKWTEEGDPAYHDYAVSRLSELSDEVYLSGIADEREHTISLGDYRPEYDEYDVNLEMGMNNGGGQSLYSDYWLLDVKA